jgi:hypothetical protein
MPLLKTVTVGDRIIDLITVHGEVVEEKKWATTQVMGSGGGFNAGSGQPSPVTISSSTTTHDQFFLRGDDGREQAFELANAGLALRKGHRMSVLWGTIKGNSSGTYLAVYNHTTSQLSEIPGSINGLAVPPMPTAVLIGYVLGVFAICVYGLGFIILPVIIILRSKRKKELIATFRREVEAAISQIRAVPPIR